MPAAIGRMKLHSKQKRSDWTVCARCGMVFLPASKYQPQKLCSRRCETEFRLEVWQQKQENP
jgi:uncharacterized OB-fold protein